MKNSQDKNKTVSCVCGATYEVHSLMEQSKIDICANCHPFYTGENRKFDTEGRIEKFVKKFGTGYRKK